MKKVVWIFSLIPLISFAFIDNTEVMKEYYDNGNIKKITPYKLGKKNGTEKTYSNTGTVIETIEYKDGNKDGQQYSYYNNGIISSHTIYIDNKKNGLEKNYFKNGNLNWQRYYQNNKLEGEVFVYFQNGKLKYKIPISDKNKAIEEYNENGVLIVNMPYNNYLDVKIKSFHETSSKIDILKGKEIFQACAACHGADGRTMALGLSNVIAGQPVDVLYQKFIEYRLRAKDETGYGDIMTSMINQLIVSDDELKSLAEYISKLK